MKSSLAVEVVDDRRYRERASGESLPSSTVLLEPKEQFPEVGRLQLTPFGMLAHSLGKQLEMESQIFAAIGPHLAPRCSACGLLAQRPETLDPASLPSEGFLAAVLHDDRQDIPLRERCELLGSERALVGDRIMRIDECSADDGEPVLALMSASSRNDFQAAVSLWLSRGSACVRVMHLAERLAPAKELARLSPSWACSGCGKIFEQASKSAILSAEPCARCRGEGWLEVEDRRLMACEECSGFGRRTELASYEWRGVELRHLAGLSLHALREGVSDGGAVARALDIAISHGFAGYPLGSPVGTMSPGERARLSAACVELSRVEDLSLVADAASLFSGGAESGAEGVSLFAPETARVSRATGRPALSGESVLLREIELGPLSVPELSFPCGGMSAIQGSSGSGKSTLLREVARLFSKRKKLASRCSFPGLKACALVDLHAPAPELVGDLVGVMSIVAEELAGTRMARERGISARDISLATSRFRCPACAALESGEGCAECGGAEIDAAAGGIMFGKRRWGEILQAPLSEVAELLWRSPAVAGIISALPARLSPRISLATRCSSLGRADRRALTVLAAVGEALSAQKGAKPASLAGELVLLDAPFCLAQGDQETLWKMLGQLNDRGATALCAGVPEALESSFDSVVRFCPSPEAGLQRAQHRMHDVRYARAASVDVVK